MNVRNVRLLDRQPGQRADDSRVVGGYTIEKIGGVPLPASWGKQKRQEEALTALAVGESFVCEDRARDARRAVKKRHPGRDFRTTVLGKGFRVWRIA